MTPSVIRIISELRHEFYSRFASAMKVPVNITGGKSYASNLSMASWMDSQQRLNYMCVYAYTAPDELVPERPFILRVAVNKGADVMVMARQEKGCQGLNRSWHFELTVLPEEILDFLPWVVSLVKSYDRGADSLVLTPPHPLHSKTSNLELLSSAWTSQASSRLSERQLLPFQSQM